MARARERAQRKSLRTLLTGMSSEHFTKMNDFDDVLRTYTPMCFVVTDLENSTGMAAADKAAYTQLQQLHDVVRFVSIASVLHTIRNAHMYQPHCSPCTSDRARVHQQAQRL